MAMSGIQIPPDVVQTYEQGLKLSREHKYLILEISGETVMIKEKGAKKATLDDFIKALEKGKDYCYGVFSGDTKIGYVIYGPMEADFKKGMIYASTAAKLHTSLTGSYDCRKAETPQDVRDRLKDQGII